MTIVNVGLGARGYDIVIEKGLLDQAHRQLQPYSRNSRIVVVSDHQVWQAQGERLRSGLAPLEVVPILLPAGEESKSWNGLANLVDQLLSLGIERLDVIVAFGGGVIGDLTGFAAAIVKRGCRFVQIPTSLLAQVDSSVGGKTGINVTAGKNLVGAFHQPALVLIDPDCLSSLDERQVRAGYAEIAKYALIEDAGFFSWLERHSAAIFTGKSDAVQEAIAVSVAGKARIVAEDERETSGTRALLNLGHTFGHALEAEAGFGDQLLHGEAVAVGIVLAFEFSARKGLCAPDDADRVARHLAAVGLPTRLSDVGMAGLGHRLTEHMMHDKKMEAGQISFVLARGIGQAFLAKPDLAEVRQFLDEAA